MPGASFAQPTLKLPRSYPEASPKLPCNKADSPL